MNLPKGKPTKRQEKQIVELRASLGHFAEMFVLSNRAKKVGINPVQVLGCNPNAGDITQEQLDTVRRAVEEAEKV